MHPIQVWDSISKQVVVEDAKHLLADPSSEKPAGHMRLVCISDTHTAHAALGTLPAGDVLVHAGDFTDIGLEADVDAFCAWLGDQKQFRHKVVIAGNHDLLLDVDSYTRNWDRFDHPTMYSTKENEAKLRSVCTYLNHEAVDIEGVRFFGSPYTPFFYDWAFNLHRQGACHEKWSSMPTNVDVLITHGPPLGHGDVCYGSGHQGCADLLDWVEAYSPKLHVFGHIHEAYGATTNRKTVFLNPSTMDLNYNSHKPRPPMVFDLPLRQG